MIARKKNYLLALPLRNKSEYYKSKTLNQKNFG